MFTEDQLTIQRLSDRVHDLEIKVKEQEWYMSVLDALETEGVSNWSGYNKAMENVNEQT